MIEKIKNLINQPRLKQLSDIRSIGLLAFGIVVLLVSWSGVSTIQTNYDLEKQVSRLQQEIQVQQLANDNIKLKNEYYNTNDYLELAARRQFGKAAPGETLVIVPKSVALRYVTSSSSLTKKLPSKQLQKSFYQQNFQDWVNFFAHRHIVE